MPVKISKNKFQFYNKPQPIAKPKPLYELFPNVITLSDGKIIRVSVPVPDRLTLIVDITSNIYGKNAPADITVAEWVKHTGDYLKDQPFNSQHVDNHYVPGPPSWYHFVMLGMGSRESKVWFEFRKATKKLPARMRLTMNPRKLGPKGFKTLINILSDPNGPFSIKPLVKSARVTKFDVAIDIVGLQTSDVIAFHPKQGKRSMYVGKDGVLETLNIHRTVSASKPAGNAMVRIYDRARERSDKGKPRPFGKAEVTRIEVTKAPKKPYNEFLKLPDSNDPFSELRVGYSGDQLSPSPLWFQYFTLIRTMPQQDAADLLQLSSGTATSFRKAMRVPSAPLVSKINNWEGWKEGLKYTGLNLLINVGK
ncbi:hypothetical protein ACR9YC_11890 [Parasphingorhabdus sp. DH2-15]|uniref:hypothetical protein n=1 Tax=Parasphingorhabdus sp. DH2-15 TaxID=3444112 RepID=UPI003F685A1C